MSHASDPTRFVPTLTDIVEVDVAIDGVVRQPELSVAPLSETPVPAASEPVPEPGAWSEALAEQMVHRVIQRVDVLLTQRVGEVVASVIEAQTRSLLPSIRQELEFAIRNSVNEAVADELSHIDQAFKSTE
ncbi:hypothetical protein [Lampropedia aestuarii]|uniref:hypothetical protein n=1 Tax=Lampropedia aestuarii TaxID=2562762 RepID=UPI001F10FBCE|nr:hypothetical protein [Lampropedia aestuarii]